MAETTKYFDEQEVTKKITVGMEAISIMIEDYISYECDMAGIAKACQDDLQLDFKNKAWVKMMLDLGRLDGMMQYSTADSLRKYCADTGLIGAVIEQVAYFVGIKIVQLEITNLV